MIGIAKLFVLILCTFLQFNISEISAANTAIMLTALIISSLPIIIKPDFLGSKWASLITNISWSIYLITALFIPAFRCYIPLAMMDITGLKLIFPGITGCICIMLEFSNEYTLNNTLSGTFFIIFLSALAIILQYAVVGKEKLSYELRRLRDNSREHELLIEENNRRLIEKQDYELYTATLRERNRIAREIHDNVGHMLTRSILQVGAIKTINTNDTLFEPLNELHETLNTAMTNIRNSVHDLHDESVDLISAIREIIDPVDTISIKLDYDMSIDVPKSIKYCFISITKEAVNNVLKHSNATEMNIIVHEHPAFYQLLIQDNGTHICLNPTDGIGLTNMKDRVKSLNGNIRITTEQGFKILISIIKNESN